MQFYVGTKRSWGAHPRIADLECDLGIAGYQQAAWDDFVETLVALQETINGIDRIDLRLGGDRPPSLPDLMGQRKVRLAAEVELTSTLKASTEGLYRSLTARQRARADRLLPPLLGGLTGSIVAGIAHLTEPIRIPAALPPKRG